MPGQRSEAVTRGAPASLDHLRDRAPHASGAPCCSCPRRLPHCRCSCPGANWDQVLEKTLDFGGLWESETVPDQVKATLASEASSRNRLGEAGGQPAWLGGHALPATCTHAWCASAPWTRAWSRQQEKAVLTRSPLQMASSTAAPSSTPLRARLQHQVTELLRALQCTGTANTVVLLLCSLLTWRAGACCRTCWAAQRRPPAYRHSMGPGHSTARVVSRKCRLHNPPLPLPCSHGTCR